MVALMYIFMVGTFELHFWQTISVTFGKITGKLTSYNKIRVKNDRLQRIFLQILACENC
jgi:hypothetical protein